jgi:hypothetical protein
MKCLFNLYRECRVLNVLDSETTMQRKIELTKDFGSEKFIKNYCSFCIKSLYAKRFKIVKYSVVNTL